MVENLVVPRYVVRQGDDVEADEDGLRRSGSWWSTSESQLALSDFESEQSFVLLGEPGIGKTTAISRHVGAGPDVTYVHLDEATDVGALQAMLSPVRARLTGVPQTLVLDGLDESPLTPKAVTRHVTNSIRGVTSIRVIVGCRSSDWYEPLADALRESIGECHVLELLPLSVEDIEQVAAANGVDGEEFVRAVRANSVGVLASIPLTLDLLLRIFERKGKLPDVPGELYEQGLRELAREPDPGRSLATRAAGESAERLAAASRIAATLLLCGGAAVTTKAASDAQEIGADELVGGHEPSPAGDVAITSTLVSGTLGTAIFTGRGSGRLGMRHASLAAYLCARYLVAHHVPEHQLRALLTRTTSLGRVGIPARLRETAAWLLAANPVQYSWIVSVDPEAVVAHGALVVDSEIRSRLVEFLLSSPDVASLRLRRRLHLRHESLCAQLRGPLQAPLGEDTGPHLGHPVARRAHTALRIARASRLVEAIPEIEGIVTKFGVNPVLRASAAHALADLDQHHASLVLPVVLSEVTTHRHHDPDDELRGIALSTCWPGTINSDSLIGALRPPSHSNVIGTYAIFLGSLIEKASEPQIVEILRSLRRASRTSEKEQQDTATTSATVFELLGGSRRERKIISELLERVVAHAQLAEMLPDASWLLAVCAKQHDAITVPRLFHSPEPNEIEVSRALRRGLIEGALQYISARRAPQLLWLWRRPNEQEVTATFRHRFLDGDDLDWLFTLSIESEWAEHCKTLIAAVFDPRDPTHQEVAWSQREHVLFEATVAWWFAPVDLHGSEAAQQRENYRILSEDVSWEGAKDHQTNLTEAWEKLQSLPGDTGSFTTLCVLLWTDPNSGTYELPPGPIEEWPSVPLADFDDSIFLSSAVAFLRAHNPNSEPWVTTTNTMSWAALAGYMALVHLKRGSHGDSVVELTDNEVAAWAATVVRFPYRMMPGFSDLHELLVEEIRSRSPDRYHRAQLDWALVNLRMGDPLPSDLHVLPDTCSPTEIDQILALFDPAVERLNAANVNVVGESVSGEPLKENADAREELMRTQSVVRFLVAFLAQTDSWPALEAATNDKTVSNCAEISALISLASLKRNSEIWPTVFARMTTDYAFGRAVALEASGSSEPWLGRLSSDELGEVAGWLFDQWGDDIVASGFGEPEDRIRDWRDHCLNMLAAQSSPHSLAQLARLSRTHHKFYRLRDLLAEAETRQRDELWRGPTPAELVAMIQDANRTIISDEDDLYRIVLAAIARFGDRLLHIGQLLWNETRPLLSTTTVGSSEAKVWAPKYESDISAALTDHLVSEFENGLVVNREVLVRQTSSKGHGLAVDILVSGPTAGSTAIAHSVPIEVKGNWNRGLFDDLEQQLVADYLPALGSRRGIYLCAWFPTSDWSDTNDGRLSVASRRNLPDTESSLARKALDASKNGVQVTGLVLTVPRPTPSARGS